MRVLIVSMVLIGLAALGCGTSDEQDGPADTTTISLGTSLDPNSVEGAFVLDGYNLAIAVLNDAATSRRFELVSYDDGGDSALVTENYRKLVDDDRVDFLLGPYGSNATLAAAAVAEAAGIPLVEANGASESVFDRGYTHVFGILTPASRYFDDVIDLAKARFANSVAILSAEGDAFSSSVAAGAKAKATSLGFEISLDATYDAAATDLSDVLTPLVRDTPDLVLVASHFSDSLTFTRELKRLGVSPKMSALTVGPAAPEYLAELKADAFFAVVPVQWTETLSLHGDDPWGTPAAFAAAVRAAVPRYADTEIPYQVAQSAMAVVVLNRAIDGAGSTDPGAVRDALVALEMQTSYGAINFDERGANIGKSMAVLQVFPDSMQHTVHPQGEVRDALWYPAPSWAQRAEGLAPGQALVEQDLKAFAAELDEDFPAIDDIAARLKTYLEDHASYYGSALAVIGSDGTVSTSPYVYRNGSEFFTVDLVTPDYDIDNQPWLADPRDTGTATWSEPYFDAGGGEIWMITYSVPLSDDNGVIAVVTTDLPLRTQSPLLDIPGACNVVEQNCAGETLAKCAVVFADATEAECVEETGTVALGESCTVGDSFGLDDCEAGGMCVKFGHANVDPAERSCKPLCLVGNDCGASERCHSLTQNLSVGFGVCLARCDVFDGACDAGTRCVPTYDWDNTQGGSCLATTGTSAVGEACHTGFDCARGTGCLRRAYDEDGTCRVLCDADHPCTETEETCDLTSTAAGAQRFGYCH